MTHWARRKELWLMYEGDIGVLVDFEDEEVEEKKSRAKLSFFKTFNSTGSPQGLFTNGENHKEVKWAKA